uniref:Uncharacterized protein n=1 Tax=Candidatus Kentrum sp. TC TaxID=2126339 RepID=A0A451ACA7_9GAMM|nr:MAG: hypothetical protein BECKTC1821E_GA0114239_11032 [Candidatus Kentron sp. TC]VFK63668.1 MAG: hypothetical protein BECKTC1821F_GA0114240_11031 [Candidatus Kentron sp. TC]
MIILVFLLSLIEWLRLRKLRFFLEKEKDLIFKKNMRIHFRFENPALFDFVHNITSNDGDEVGAIKVKLQKGRKVILFLSSLFFSILAVDILMAVSKIFP